MGVGTVLVHDLALAAHRSGFHHLTAEILTDKGKGIVYRAFAGPYASAEEATQACNSLRAAGLSACFVQRN